MNSLPIGKGKEELVSAPYVITVSAPYDIRSRDVVYDGETKVSEYPWDRLHAILAMKRSILGILLRDKIWSEVIRKKTKVTGVVRKVSKLKWQRRVGRPPAGWIDELKRVAGSAWRAKTGDRVLWYLGGSLRTAVDCNRLMMIIPLSYHTNIIIAKVCE